MIFSRDLLNTFHGIFYDLFFTRPLFVVHVYIAAVVIYVRVICYGLIIKRVLQRRGFLYNINYNILHLCI